jgi:nickel/cobalt exporter
MRRAFARAAVVALAGSGLLLVGAGSASAHPLGNFTVNYYEGLTLTAHDIRVLAVVDSAELPTYNRIEPAVDGNGDGRNTEAEKSAYATRACAHLAGGLMLTANSARAPLTTTTASFALLPSPTLRGLSTGRLTCNLVAKADLSRPTPVAFTDHVDATYGWHEITVVGDDVHVTNSTVNDSHGAVASSSISDELRHYPGGLLSTPLDIRAVQMSVAPGRGAAAAGKYNVARPNALTAALQPLSNAFERAAGSRQLTIPVIALAIVLSMLLGAGHAVLPGHGKTVMAAYLVGRRGTFRDALLVGATVTVSHTIGVITLGLAIALSAAWVSTTTLQYLGVASGLLIASVGVSLLRGSWRRHGHEHPHEHPHAHAHPHAGHVHEHPHPHQHPHGHGHGHAHEPARGFSRRGLVGLGVAGGLVPSPSALVVLLSAIALGRTAFGVVLVLGYGVGMAVTLMLAGLALSRVGRAAGTVVHSRAVDRYIRFVPQLTAALVIVVGCGLALRSVSLA